MKNIHAAAGCGQRIGLLPLGSLCASRAHCHQQQADTELLDSLQIASKQDCLVPTLRLSASSCSTVSGGSRATPGEARVSTGRPSLEMVYSSSRFWLLILTYLP